MVSDGVTEGDMDEVVTVLVFLNYTSRHCYYAVSMGKRKGWTMRPLKTVRRFRSRQFVVMRSFFKNVSSEIHQGGLRMQRLPLLYLSSDPISQSSLKLTAAHI